MSKTNYSYHPNLPAKKRNGTNGIPGSPLPQTPHGRGTAGVTGVITFMETSTYRKSTESGTHLGWPNARQWFHFSLAHAGNLQVLLGG